MYAALLDCGELLANWHELSGIKTVNDMIILHVSMIYTFLTKSCTTSRLKTSSASLHRPRESYVRKHSDTSAISFAFSDSVLGL